MENAEISKLITLAGEVDHLAESAPRPCARCGQPGRGGYLVRGLVVVLCPDHYGLAGLATVLDRVPPPARG